MSLFTALSGLNAAQSDISVTSNNIANVGTVGFHGSRAEFADIYSNSPYSSPTSTVGMGTELTRIGVDFSQGSLQATGNVMDLSIQGPGFFQVQTGLGEGQDMAYTRAGAFNMDRDGYVTNSAGHYLTVFPTAANGDTLSMSGTTPLLVPQQSGTPQATERVDLEMQISVSDNGGLGTQGAVPAAPFNPQDPTTFAHSVSLPMLNDEGLAVPATAYFVLADAPDPLDASISYSLEIVVDGQVTVPADPAARLSFDGDGVQTGALNDLAFTIPNGADIAVNMSGSTASQAAFGVSSVQQDGQSRQDLSSLEVRDDGVVWASYGGEVSRAVGQVAMANFADLQGLSSIGNSSYMASRASGDVRLGSPGAAGFGSVRSGSVEQANVNLTEELVDLIMAQRNYQASAKALETNGKLSETIMNMRT